MKKYCLHILAVALLALSAIGNSCSGQVKEERLQDRVSASKVVPAGQPKLIANLGSPNHKGNNVHCGLQDRAGSLWFGTTGDGVYAYDGKLFTQFTTSNGLNSNTVWCIFEDKVGRIWIGTSDGVCVYEHKVFTRVKIPLPGDTLGSKYDVWSIMQDRSGRLWFATNMGVYIYDGKSFSSFTVTEEAKNCFFRIEKILEDKEGNFWFGGRCYPGVFRYDGTSINHLKPNGDDWAWPVLQDKNGNVWLSSWNGAYRYDGKSFLTFTKSDGLSVGVVTRIVEDMRGNLWFGGDGLCRYDGKVFTPIAKDGLTNSAVWTILEDKSGKFWVGTRETGLYLYDGKRFTKFSE